MRIDFSHPRSGFITYPPLPATHYLCPVGFLYPLFLLAAASLAIPVLIHLFNLRRYKTVLFPATRFLKNIQLRSRRQSQVRYKLLLALRLLFLAVLILAFAQPFFQGNKSRNASANLQVIYLDNSPSMGIKKGVRSLFELARDAARKQVQSAPTGTRFLLLNNDKTTAYQPQPADKVLASIAAMELSPAGKSNAQLLAGVQSLLQSETNAGADVFYYSDFQRNAFTAHPDAALLKGITFHGVAVQAPQPTNIFIDTAWLASPVLQTGQPVQLMVRSRLTGTPPADVPVLQLSINGQVKSAASLKFTNNVSTDTISFSVNDAGWQRMQLSVNDAGLRFDDTFRISARSAPALSVLVLNEGAGNPYIQAAFRSYSGFRVMEESVATAPADWKNYNLIIFNGITHLDEAILRHLGEALQAGQSIAVFPGKTRNVEGLNAALRAAGDIRIAGFDTASQAATTLQQGSDLVKDLFEQLPPNVQLPVASWHYTIQSGLNANGQSVLSFRNGDPFLAKYTPAKGTLYLLATSADPESGNFPSSYFFVPFLYQMAMQSRGGDVYALTAGAGQAAYLPLSNTGDRNMIHLYGAGNMDAIPPQRPSAGGVEVFVDAAVQQPGFYKLAAGSGDSAVVALNAPRTESILETWDLAALKRDWNGKDATWQSAEQFNQSAASGQTGSFPLWKVCIILALLLLAVETWLLARNQASPTIATS